MLIERYHYHIVDKVRFKINKLHLFIIGDIFCPTFLIVLPEIKEKYIKNSVK